MNKLLYEELFYRAVFDSDLKEIVFDYLEKINKMYENDRFGLIELYASRLNRRYIETIDENDIDKLFEVLILKLSLSDKLPKYSILEKHVDRVKKEIMDLTNYYHKKLQYKFNGELISDIEQLTLLIMDNKNIREKFMRELFDLNEEKYRIVLYDLKYYDELKRISLVDERLEPLINQKISEILKNYDVKNLIKKIIGIRRSLW